MNKDSKLYAEVERMIDDQLEDDYTLEEFITDLMQGGCESGLVGGMIYYKDTLPFYQRHKAEINALLTESMDDFGSHNPADVFGKNWEDIDPLALYTSNQNLLAWYGFEETARRIAYDHNLDV